MGPLTTAGVDVFHPSTRRHSEPAFPELNGTDAERSLAGWTKKNPEHPTITVESIGLAKSIEGQGDTPDGHAEIASLQTLVHQYERGEFDVAAVGRAALANPDFVNKLRAARHNELIAYNLQKHKLTLH